MPIQMGNIKISLPDFEEGNLFTPIIRKTKAWYGQQGSKELVTTNNKSCDENSQTRNSRRVLSKSVRKNSWPTLLSFVKTQKQKS